MDCDIAVVGNGRNLLVAAAYLVLCGDKVEVLGRAAGAAGSP